MKLLFVLGQKALLRHFETVVLELVHRGHTVRLASADRAKMVPLPLRLKDRPEVSEVSCPAGRSDDWDAPARLLRALRDYSRYIEPSYARATKLRQRALRNLVKAATGDDERSHIKMQCPHCRRAIRDEEWVLGLRRLKNETGDKLPRLMNLAERALPVDPAVRTFIETESPSVVIITPLLNLGASQADFVHAARALGVPVVFPVFSWDNLSNKGIVHAVPDRVLVWNERQRREATEWHGVPADRIVVTGAARFDDFIAFKPSVDRAGFCETRGFRHDSAILTYLGSSPFIAPNERGFVQGWIDRIRAVPDTRLREANIIVRPHPRARFTLGGTESPAGERVHVSASDYANADQTLFDCLYHSDAAVGLNTSAEIEAALVGCPVYTIRTEQFAAGQEGTQHFRYLLSEEGGFVEAAESLEDHLAQLSQAVAGRFDRERIEAFRGAFIRPHGYERPVTPRVVAAIEEMGTDRSARSARCQGG